MVLPSILSLMCILFSAACPAGQFRCATNSSSCLPMDYWCDREVHCPDGSDEFDNCSLGQLLYFIHRFWEHVDEQLWHICSRFPKKMYMYFTFCTVDAHCCVLFYNMVIVFYCVSPIPTTPPPPLACFPGQISCDGRCVSPSLQCDGVRHCIDYDDEMLNCSKC